MLPWQRVNGVLGFDITTASSMVADVESWSEGHDQSSESCLSLDSIAPDRPSYSIGHQLERLAAQIRAIGYTILIVVPASASILASRHPRYWFWCRVVESGAESLIIHHARDAQTPD